MPLIDWKNPPRLDAPKRRQVLSQFADRLKLARAKAKRAKGPKNHATNQERSFAERTLAKERAEKIASRTAAFRAFKNQVRAYFAGERDSYPKRPTPPGAG